MELLIFPQLRQTYGYDCGAKVVQEVLLYYGIRVRQDKVMNMTGTSLEGTPIRGILDTFHHYGLQTTSESMTRKKIQDYLHKEIPVILPLQAWPEKKVTNWKKHWDDGHYVVAIGYIEDRIIFEDPSVFGRAYLTFDELEERWHDEDVDGTRYIHHGIAVYGKPPTFELNRLIHLD